MFSISKYLIVIIILTFGLSSGNKESDWKLIKSTQGIAVYSRFPDDSPFKEIKVLTQLESSLSAIISVLSDVPNYTSWVYSCVKAKTVEIVNETEEYYYTETEVPWPMSNRDVVVRSMLVQDPVSKIVFSKVVGVHGRVAENPGVIRVKDVVLTWRFIPLKDRRVNVIYEIKLDPAGEIPAWLVNLTAEVGPVYLIDGLKKEIAKDKYKNVKLDFIKEFE